MVNFAPTVFVSKYLESVGQLTGERREDAIDYIFRGGLILFVGKFRKLISGISIIIPHWVTLGFS